MSFTYIPIYIHTKIPIYIRVYIPFYIQYIDNCIYVYDM